MTLRANCLPLPLAVPILLALTGCGGGFAGQEDQNDTEAAPTGSQEAQNAADPAPTPEPEPQVTEARSELESSIDRIGADFGGSLGIAVIDVEAGWQTGFNENAILPQQSVSKLWVTLAAMKQAEKGELDLAAPIRVTREDLTLFHQPMRKAILRDGAVETDAADLIERAIQQSDNTANNALLQRVGGPEAVRATLAELGLDEIRFGPGEKPMQSAIAGMEWNDFYSYGSNFFDARDRVPDSVRREAFQNYLADPVDGASAAAIARAMAMLAGGELLSPALTERLLATLADTRSGPRRLKGGRAEGWVVAHKTGTGQFWNGMQSGYNDVGVLFAPDSTAYAVAVMIGVTDKPTPARMEMMQAVTRAVIAYHEAKAAPPSVDDEAEEPEPAPDEA